MKKAILSILVGGVLMIVSQAQAHDFLPDMKTGVWVADKMTVLNNGVRGVVELAKDQSFNIDYFLGSPLVCVGSHCEVQNSAMSDGQWYPAVGEIRGDQLVLTTELLSSQETKIEKYVRVSDSLVVMQGSIKNRVNEKTRIAYTYAFKKVGDQ